ncbi:protein ROH1 [Amaranthus tricolor]|uniref:protein ROH1 n=1 Tax=Amaranthus tricolor TaxID=29722 RepID=UPI002586EC15|nr:protein ROH1 [Amaranthus tricolor]
MWAAGADNQGNFLGRISIRRNQVASMEGEAEDLELFQRKICDCFSDLLPPSNTKKDNNHTPLLPPSLSLTTTTVDPPIDGDNDGDTTPFAGGETLLSIPWLRKLLDAFLCCEAEFKAVLLMGREPSQIAKSPLDRMIPDFLDRTVKAMDVCNAISHGVDAIKFMQSQAQIIVSALEQRPFTDGQIKRARRALAALQGSIVVDEKENNGKSTERSWSFGRRTGGAGASVKERHHAPNFSWSVAKHWSAAKQIQSISSNLYPPRGGESTGLALTVYIMSVVLVFVMWTLVAAIPCQDRAGLGTHIPVPKQLNWAHGMCGIQEKIAEEWKRKEKKGSAGLVKEVVKVEKLGQSLVEFADNFQYPMEEEKEAEFASQVSELAEICRRMDDGLSPLQVQIRELFHRLVKSRATMLDVLEQAAKSATPDV